MNVMNNTKVVILGLPIKSNNFRATNAIAVYKYVTLLYDVKKYNLCKVRLL